jgi:hypothetical protein
MNKAVDMKRILTIFFLTTSVARGQSNLNNTITSDFLSDSLGCNGLRQKHVKEVPFDDQLPMATNSPVQVLFDGKSIIGESKESIISLLGSPNWTTFSKKKQDKNSIKNKTGGTWRMTNDTLTIIAPKSKKKFDEMHYCINTCGHQRLGTTLILFFTYNKVTDAFFVVMN